MMLPLPPLWRLPPELLILGSIVLSEILFGLQLT